MSSARDTELTAEEKSTIRALRKLAAAWPATLWLFADGSSLRLMRAGPDGQHVMQGERGSVDLSYEVATIHGIDCDGGAS